MNNTNDNLEDELLEKVLDDGNKDDAKIAKVLLLTTELQEKDKKIEHMKNSMDEKMNNYLKYKYINS